MARQKNDGRGRLGGRQKGTPNKSTSTIREAIAAQWQHYQQSGQFQKDIDSLDPSSRAIIMEKYAQYITPRMKSVDLDIIQPVTLTIEDRLRQLCNPDQHASTDSEAED
ncbi:MAG: hypothetical protein HDR49_00170 [Bacteroides sp.]|nr:hypothetical protein [Bacteroides sp.]